MIIVSGRTFEHRERLKRLGGAWIEAKKHWLFDSDRHIDELKLLVGCMVSSPVDSAPPPDDETKMSFADLYRSLVEAAAEGKNSEPTTGNRPTAIYGDDQRYLDYFRDKQPLAFFGFSSLGEMCDYVDQRKEHEIRRSGASRDEWCGGSMSDALRMGRHGWPEGYSNASEVAGALNVAHAIKRRRLLGLTGGHVSVGRMLAGNPAHMVKRPKLPGKRIVTLFVETGGSSGIEAETMIVRAAAVAGICDVLEREGYSCEIVALSVNRRSNGMPGSQTAVTIKHAGEKNNLNDLVFALGHPAYLRRLVFACVTSSIECETIWQTQGKPTEAFNEYHPTGKNEFYIRRITIEEQEKIGKHGSLRTRALRMLPFIEPTNLPVKILER